MSNDYNRPDFVELQKTLREGTEDLTIDPTNTHMFHNKISEITLKKMSEEVHLERSYQSLFSANEENKWWFELVITNSKKRIHLFSKEISRFTYYLNRSKGKVDISKNKPINLDVIKQISPDTLLGKPARKDSKTLTFSCPLHSEKTPSFNWSRQKHLWHCFGCSAGGSIIDLYMLLNKCDFKTAIKELEKLI